MLVKNNDTSKLKGSTKPYTQGVWYSKDGNDAGSKLQMKDVSVQIAAEGANASALMTALGAVAMGVAALSF